MDNWSSCDTCGCAYIFHAHEGTSRHDPKDAPVGACLLSPDFTKFSKTKTFEHRRSSMIPDCVPNGGIEIGDGYYRG